MSRIGEKPIIIPEGVTVKKEGGDILVQGPKGNLVLKVASNLGVEIADNRILVYRKNEQIKSKALHGTIRQLLANMVHGVNEGWSKKLEVVGTGFRASLSGQNLVLLLGFSHPVEIIPLEGITFNVTENKIVVSGSDKSVVGLMAAKIRGIKPPDPYKGKGIRNEGEIIKLKPGKQAKIGVIGSTGGKAGGK